MFDHTSKCTPTEHLALKLAWAQSRIENAERPVDRKTAKAEMLGMTKAAYALGYGHTEFHIEMEVMETYRDLPLPPYTPTNGGPRIAWETVIIEALTPKLDDIKRPA